MFLLALDTCDARGSIALLNDQQVLSELPHPPAEDFSSWLLPAVDRMLASHSVSHADLMGYAVASGPGSFTGVRVGLTTVKAWAEIYAKPIFPVSRLAVLADRATDHVEYAATFIDAQRHQLFGAVYHRRASHEWSLIGEEAVIEPLEFFQFAVERAAGAGLSWVSMDPQILISSSFWSSQATAARIISVDPPLAAALGRHVLAHRKQGTDPLLLDANYVRRSDAEIFGKKAAAQ